MKSLVFLTALSFFLLRADAQDTTHLSAPSIATKKDSSAPGRRKSEIYRETFKHVRRKFDSTLFTSSQAPTSSDYAEDLEHIYQLLNKVPIITESFSKLSDIDNRLDTEDSALVILKERMSQDDRSLNIRNLQMFNTLLDALAENVKGYSRTLNQYDTALDGIRKEIAGLRKDSLILHVFRDSALKDTFRLQLQQLKAKWRQVDSLVALNGQMVNSLKSEASAHSITISDLQYQVDQALKAVGSKAFGKERRYLWEPRTTGRAYSKESLAKSVDTEQQLARFYFNNNRNKRVWLLFTGLVFFYWVWYNFRSLRDRKSVV